MSKSTKRPNKLVDNVGHPSGSEEEPIDTGLIRCICNSADDDGFTIQCERCLVWQHAFCVNITQTNIPEQYFCDQCTGQRPDAATKGRKPMDHSPSNSRRPVVEKGKHGSRPPLVGKRKESSKSLERIKPSSVNSLDDVPVDMPSDWFSPTDLDSPPVKSPRPRKGSFGTMLIKGRHAQQIIMETRDKWMKLPRWTGPLFHNDRADPLRHSLMSGLYNTMNSNTMANTISKLAVQSIPQQQQQDQLGLFASREIKADTYLMEVTGTVMLKSEYKYDPDNLYGFLGTPLPKVFFYPFLNVCIDARDQGNDVRHIRRSCFPNAEVKNIVLPYSREDTIHLGLFSRQPIQPGDEITIGWNWQHGHVAWKKYQEQVASDGHGHHHVIDEQGMRKNRQTLQRMLQCWETTFGTCACSNKKACFLERWKREVDQDNDRTMIHEAIYHDSPSSITSPSSVEHHDVTLERKRPFSSALPPSKRHSPERVSPDVIPSRQIAVDKMRHDVQAMLPSPIEENMDIDVTSTSPRSASPGIRGNAPLETHNVDDMEADGETDIDIGEEPSVASMTGGPRHKDGQQPDEPSSSSFSSSSLSSLSGSESGASGKPGKSSVSRAKKTALPMLPSKKMWMQKFNRQKPAPHDPASVATEDEHVVGPSVNEDIKSEPLVETEAKVNSLPVVGKESTTETTPLVTEKQDDVMDSHESPVAAVPPCPSPAEDGTHGADDGSPHGQSKLSLANTQNTKPMDKASRMDSWLDNVHQETQPMPLSLSDHKTPTDDTTHANETGSPAPSHPHPQKEQFETVPNVDPTMKDASAYTASESVDFMEAPEGLGMDDEDMSDVASSASTIPLNEDHPFGSMPHQVTHDPPPKMTAAAFAQVNYGCSERGREPRSGLHDTTTTANIEVKPTAHV